MSYTFEICANGIDSAINAMQAGAARIELCSDLVEGGITPSYGTIKRTVELVSSSLVVHVLIRPRGGDFLYSEDEIAIMCDDIATARDLGVDGVVIGALKEDGSLDVKAMERMIKSASHLSVTCHRAFDMCKDAYAAIDVLKDLGVNRVLSSGQKPNALEGAINLKNFAEYAGSSLVFMAGAGINKGNIAFIRNSSGLNEFHLSGKSKVLSAMNFKNEELSMSSSHVVIDEYARDVSSVQIIKDVMGALN